MSALEDVRELPEATLWQLLICEMTGFVPHAGQMTAIQAMGTSRFNVLICGRRWGKSELLARRALAGLLRPNTTTWVVAPTYDLTRRVWKPMKAALYRQVLPGLVQYGIPRPRVKRDLDSMQGREIELSNGSVIVGKSADNLTSLLGEGLDLVILDESGRMSRSAWESAIQPALLDRGGSACLATTPVGWDWNQELYEYGQDPSLEDWSSIQSPTWANSYLPRDVLPTLRRTMSRQSWEQEIAARFTAKAGAVFTDWKRERHVQHVPFDPSLSVDIGVDFGFRDFAVVATQITRGGEMRVFDELPLQNVRTSDAIAAIQSKPWARSIERIAVDPAGTGTNLQSGLSDVDLFREAFPHARVVFSTQVQHRSPEWRSARLRDRLWSCTGESLIKVDPSCRATISMFEKSEYPDKGGRADAPVKDGIWDHMRDALGYLEVVAFHLQAPQILSRRPF